MSNVHSECLFFVKYYCITSFNNFVLYLQEYQKLKKEVEGLRALVDLNKAGKNELGRQSFRFLGLF